MSDDTLKEEDQDDGDPLGRLLDLLDLREVGPDCFEGGTPAGGGWRLFGGQVASQALRAAAATVRADHHVHSLRAYFLRPGRHGPPVRFSVDRLRDGSSFTTRRVVAVQGGDAILNLDASFHRDEPGDEHRPGSPVDGVDPPERSAPASGPPWLRWRPVDMRTAVPVVPVGPGEPAAPVAPAGRASRVVPAVSAVSAAPGAATFSPRRMVWVRVPQPLPDDPVLHACLLTYLSDMGPVRVVSASVRREPGELMMASLDHCLWFHQRARADRWLLYELDPVAAGHGRGLAHGSIWTADGRLAATVMQEVLARRRRP